MNFIEIKEQARKKYKKIKQVKCPAFENELVYFNSKGFMHLIYKGPRSGRNTKEILVRLKLLDRAIELLKKSGFSQEQGEEKLFINKKKKIVKFWAFEAVVKNKRIKVLVRQIGNGKKHFWSVIPQWRKDRYGKIKNYKKRLSKY